jgi:hypothetical protein
MSVATSGALCRCVTAFLYLLNRRSDGNAADKVNYTQTHEWHFFDIEIPGLDVNAACFGHPPLLAGAAAAVGPPVDFVIDKISLLALQFLLHFLGDLHHYWDTEFVRRLGPDPALVASRQIAGITSGKRAS